MEINRLLTNNKIWVERTKGVGIIRRADAIDFVLRALSARLRRSL